MSRFLEITCPKEQARYRRAGMLWLRDGYDPTDEYFLCGDRGEVTDFLCGDRGEVTEEYQKEMLARGWKYAILIEEDDEGDD